MINEFSVTILDDGSVRIETDSFDGAKHGDAEALLRQIAEEMGGEVTVTKRKVPEAHKHLHDHLHDHGHDHVHL